MDIYYQTATGFGVVNDAASVPEGATVITEAQYEALLVAAEDAAQDAADADLAAANARWTLVHDALVAATVSEAAAVVLADAVGIQPNEV